MCWEDIKIGRKSKVVEAQIPCPNITATMLVGRNKKRISLVIGSGQVGFLTIGLRKSSVDNTHGVIIFPTALPLILNIKDHGDLVCNEFFAWANGASENITVWETVLDEDGPTK